ncbi:lysine N(6)-hydroxylase/L-ornithine N(5)-oxygenase family protein [Paraburkholderia antibiotica]|uniref:SidA/IucD/PvdA family monooxygenase n=1 Tax=Paraburkholderia antibiotica TaxID=2728839 RepID=A0A7X9X615_9BURK|nr:SidA/IucD/PvdA family monooxygenase [Paraburkholderia antibiotica]NML31759.1 SidA/IucD/PvdA family monooxygenase [Paraburkholderia antibiotica]
MKQIFDVVGVGFGPANIALAIALEELRPELKCIFLERNEEVVWQKNMLFENALDVHSNIQNIPHRDLVTPRNPRSRYTFLNYLHENGLLFKHLNMDLMLPMRPEYARYISWVARELSSVFRGSAAVSSIAVSEDETVYEVRLADGETISARNVVLGTGRQARIPEIFRNLGSSNVVHFTQYLSAIERLVNEGAQAVAVVGSSQTAAELMLHLTKQYPQLKVDGIMRRFAFPLKDTSPFMSEIYFPEFTDAYYKASPALKKRFDRDVYRTNYGAADMDVIEEIYKQIYHDSLSGRNQLTLHRMTDISQAAIADGKIRLTLEHHLESATRDHHYDGVILATGFVNFGSGDDEIKVPALLNNVRDYLSLEAGAVAVNRDYSVSTSAAAPGRIFLNGLSEAMHGMGDAGSLSLSSIRAKDIVDALTTRVPA